MQLLSIELRVYSFVSVLVNTNNVLSQMAVDSLVALIQYDEEEIETRHDGRRHVDVRAQRCLAVVASADRISRSKDRGTGVEGGLDAGLSNRDCLLFHSFVDSDLIGNIHLVELVDGADTVVSQHESTGLDCELSSLLVLDYRGCKTGS